MQSMLKKYGRSLLFVLMPFVVAVYAAEPDWPCFRGPNHNSISSEIDWAPLKSTNDLEIIWEKNIGDGYSCVTIAGSNLYAMGNMHGTSTVWCLKAETGKKVWQYSFPSPAGQFKGPRATPVWADSRLYVASREGNIFCLDAENGTLLWQKDMVKLYGIELCKFGLGSSIRVMDNLVLINENLYGLALNKKTGDTAWSSPAGMGGYSSPVIADLKDKRHGIFFGLDALYGVDPSTGDKLWMFPWPSKFRVNAADPLVIDDTIFISSGYGKGCALVQVNGTTVTQLWANTEMKNQFSTSILLDGYLYGCDGDAGKGDLVCLDAKTGKEQWRQKTGFFSTVSANNILILLTEKGELIFSATAPDAYKELGRCKVFNNTTERCWTMPVLCRGNLYCRNSAGRLICIDLKI
jgi:outer membrane protein assembly factor BamB